MTGGKGTGKGGEGGGWGGIGDARSNNTEGGANQRPARKKSSSPLKKAQRAWPEQEQNAAQASGCRRELALGTPIATQFHAESRADAQASVRPTATFFACEKACSKGGRSSLEEGPKDSRRWDSVVFWQQAMMQKGKWQCPCISLEFSLQAKARSEPKRGQRAAAAKIHLFSNSKRRSKIKKRRPSNSP